MQRTAETPLRRRSRTALAFSVALAVLAIGCGGKRQLELDPNQTFDGLVRITNARAALAYIDPDADFSEFERVKILDPYVAFRKNWQRDQARSGSRRRVTSEDMERIKADVGALFLQVFTDVLQDGGYQLTDTADHDVLLLRPAIIDLDITAPDTMTAGRSRTFVSDVGAATLYLELFDSVSGDRIGRAADRRAARSAAGTVTWSNRVQNVAEARSMFRTWATRLREFLDLHYRPGSAKVDPKIESE